MNFLAKIDSILGKENWEAMLMKTANYPLTGYFEVFLKKKIIRSQNCKEATCQDFIIFFISF